MEKEKEYQGLSGWLILVGIGVVISPLRMLVELIPMYKDIFENGSWEILTTPGTGIYNALWGPYIIIELFINILLVVTSTYLIYLFFKKKNYFLNCT